METKPCCLLDSSNNYVVGFSIRTRPIFAVLASSTSQCMAIGSAVSTLLCNGFMHNRSVTATGLKECKDWGQITRGWHTDSPAKEPGHELTVFTSNPTVTHCTPTEDNWRFGEKYRHHLQVRIVSMKTKFRGLGPRANYTEWATAACRRS
jgi:hypothetical protein